MTPQNSSWHPRREKCSKEDESRDSKRPNGKTAEKLTPWGSSQSYVFRKAAWCYSDLEVQHSKSEPSFLLGLCAELTHNSQPVPLRTPLQSKTVYNCALLCSFYVQVIGEMPSKLQSLPPLLQDAAGEGDRVDAGIRQLDSDPTTATHQLCDLGQGLSKAVSSSAEGT